MDIEQIAIQQIVTDGKTHDCCICYKFKNKHPKVTERHLIAKHKEILTLIAKEQE